ncbi:MAG: ribosome biogenesis GTPase Der [FCB group bacterium]|jgi:GTP-binding protein|nr:ribosome biogenesis GTPase Der [FCB group bacterium]
MSQKRKLPLVAICGRPNVGKSTLFNRIIGKQRAIVHLEEGITRDRTYGTAEWEGRKFRVVDTGGVVEDPVDPITEKMQQQVRTALEEAKVIVFVVDGQQELTRIDEQLRDELFKYGKPVVLAVNKLDNERMEQNVYDFYSLGFGEPHAISSGHGIGVDLLLDAVLAHLPEPVEGSEEEVEEEEEAPRPMRIAIVGKPNVGKSSFVNAILNEERTIVTDVPGTTRDSIDVEFRWKDRDYVLVDTAGLRKKAGITREVERFSVSRTLRAVKSADVALIMIDSTEGISEQDKRIIGFAVESGTAMVLVWTKWDLIEDKEVAFKKIPDELDLKAPFVKYVPYLTISNLTRQRIFTAFEYVDRVGREAEKRIGTGELNRLMDELRAASPPTGAKGQAAKILYATQASIKPTVFVLFVNRVKLFHFSYIRFIENRVREKYGFEGVPIRIELREGKPRT